MKPVSLIATSVLLSTLANHAVADEKMQAIFSENCIVTPPYQATVAESAIASTAAAILIPIVVERIFNFASEKFLDNELEHQSSVDIDIPLYVRDRIDGSMISRNRITDCVTIIADNYPLPESNPEIVTESALSTSKPYPLDRKKIRERLKRHGISWHESDTRLPSILIEASFEYSEDGTAMRLVPRLLGVNSWPQLLPKLQAIKEGIKVEFGERNLATSIEILGPAASPNGTKYAAVTLDFGKIVVEKGGLFHLEKGEKRSLPIGPENQAFAKKFRSGWLSVIGLNKATKEVFKNDENMEISAFMPSSSKVKLVTSRDPDQIRNFIAATLSSVAKPVSEALVASSLITKEGEIDKLNQTLAVLDAEIALELAKVFPETTSATLVDLNKTKLETALAITKLLRGD